MTPDPDLEDTREEDERDIERRIEDEYEAADRKHEEREDR